MVMHTADGNNKSITLRKVKYVPGLWFNLFSIPVALKGGWNLGNEGPYIQHVTTKWQSSKIKFNHILKCGQGYVCGIILSPITRRSGTKPLITNMLAYNAAQTLLMMSTIEKIEKIQPMHDEHLGQVQK
jgi:hypothetical protein